MANPQSKVKLKLFIDKKAEKVVFAEAGKNFVDFLIHFLSLPLATVARLLKKECMMSSLGNLYESIQNLADSYLLPNQVKNSLLYPSTLLCATDMPLVLSGIQDRTPYACPDRHWYVGDVPNLLCPCCRKKMTSRFDYVPPSPENTGITFEGGFVKGSLTFIVMDNLEFMPMSTNHLFDLLNKCNVKEFGALEEMVVELGVDEDLKLLKLSIESQTVLSSFYFGNVADK